MIKEKLCAFCNQPFVPRSSYQRYCKRPHYMNCPVCGKQYLVTNNENLKRPPVACSYACRRAKADKTCLERYGTKCSANGEEQKIKARQTMVEKYGAEYTLQSSELKERAKQTMVEKYGADHPMHSDSIKAKMIATNIERFGTTTYLTSEEGKKEYKEKMIERYGVEHPIQNEDIKAKIKTTIKNKYGEDWFAKSEYGKLKIKNIVRSKYGVDYVTQIPAVKEKVKQTSLERYNVTNPAKSNQIKQKIKQAMEDKYGVRSVMEVPEIRERIMKTSMERYGVPFYIMKPEVKTSSGAISKFNLRFADKLKERNINFEMEYRIDTRSFDFYIPDKNLIVDLNPTYTHNLIGNHWSNKGVELDYHKKRCEAVLNNGKSIRCMFDWDNENELLDELVASCNHIELKDVRLYKLNRKVGIQFLSRCGRSRRKQYPRKMLTVGAVYNDSVIAAIAIGLNKDRNLINYTYCIIDYGMEWGCDNSELFRLMLQNINELIPCSDIVLKIDSDRFMIEDATNLSLKQLQWLGPTTFWSRKRTRISVNNCNSSQENLVSDGWLPVADCGQIVFHIDLI